MVNQEYIIATYNQIDRAHMITKMGTNDKKETTITTIVMIWTVNI